MQAIFARHEVWRKRMPDEVSGLWSFVIHLTLPEQTELLAHCASLSLDAVCARGDEQSPHSDIIAREIGLDMARYWTVTAENYLSRVSKDRIGEAVRDGVSKEAAENLATMKKAAMAEAAAASRVQVGYRKCCGCRTRRRTKW